MGEIMFTVYWSVDSEDDPQLYFICKDCATMLTQERMVPGGRI